MLLRIVTIASLSVALLTPAAQAQLAPSGGVRQDAARAATTVQSVAVVDSTRDGHLRPSAPPTLPAERSLLARHPAGAIAAIGITTTLVLRPLDEPITDGLRAPSVQRLAVLRSTADVLNTIGGVGFVVSSAALLGTGYIRHDATTTQLGIRTSEALVLNSIVTALLKGAFGRQRPFVNEETPNVFAAGRGFGTPGRTSFPSGHASTSFAFATALTSALRVRNPKAARYVGPALYGTAALVGVSRVYGAHHWASDIAAGATIGTLSGWLVTRHDVDVGAGTVRWRF